MNKIEELENNGYVVVDVRLADGRQMSIEEYEEDVEVVAVTVVTADEYEANGYDVEGLQAKEVEF